MGVAQLVERRVVVADAAGSSPVTHPTARVLSSAWAESIHVDVLHRSVVSWVDRSVCDTAERTGSGHRVVVPMTAPALEWTAPLALEFLHSLPAPVIESLQCETRLGVAPLRRPPFPIPALV